MADGKVEFGYNPPSGARGAEQFPSETFVRNLQNAVDIASPHFSSFRVSDHLITVEPFRMEGWTQLAWIAAATRPRWWAPSCWRIRPTPSLVAKMGARLQA